MSQIQRGERGKGGRYPRLPAVFQDPRTPGREMPQTAHARTRCCNPRTRVVRTVYNGSPAGVGQGFQRPQVLAPPHARRWGHLGARVSGGGGARSRARRSRPERVLPGDPPGVPRALAEPSHPARRRCRAPSPPECTFPAGLTLRGRTATARRGRCPGPRSAPRLPQSPAPLPCSPAGAGEDAPRRLAGSRSLQASSGPDEGSPRPRPLPAPRPRPRARRPSH